jgi:hypothetical protein
MLFIALRAAIFGAGFIFLWGWVALSLRNRYDRALGFALGGWTRALGTALMAAGGILAFACVATSSSAGKARPRHSTRRASSLPRVPTGLCAIRCTLAASSCSWASA